MKSALEEMQQLHAELGRKLDAHKASDPNDNEGIGRLASKQKGVGKCIEIMQRRGGSVDPADIWDAYCDETPEDRRSPQGALAFGFAWHNPN